MGFVLRKIQGKGMQDIVLDAIKKGNTSRKQITEATGFPYHRTSAALGKLRRWGFVEPLGNGFYRVVT